MTDTTTESETPLRERLISGVSADGIGLKIVRGLGWLFIWAGLFLLGFVAHQLFVTDFFAERAQRGLEAELAERGALEAEVVPYNPETGELGTPVTSIPVPDDDTPPASTPGVGDPATTPTNVEVEPLDFFLIREPRPAIGEAAGTIRIPTIGIGWTVVEGIARSTLKKGAGHMPATPLPGQPGNAVVSGHRTTFGAPFHNADDLEAGDLIFWDSPIIGTHTYVIRDTQIVRPTALWVTGHLMFDDGSVRPAPGQQAGSAWLTLTTCHPKFSARQRLIVFAELVDGPNAPAILGEA